MPAWTPTSKRGTAHNPVGAFHPCFLQAAASPEGAANIVVMPKGQGPGKVLRNKTCALEVKPGALDEALLQEVAPRNELSEVVRPRVPNDASLLYSVLGNLKVLMGPCIPL